MMSDINISRIDSKIEIYNTFEKLKNCFFSFDGDLNSLIEKIHKNGVCFVCTDDEICGVIAFYANNFENKTAFITSLLIDENHRGKGIATKLIYAAESYSTECGMKKISLEVNKKNDIAIKLYTKLGYLKYDETDNSIFMTKVLKK